MDASHQGHRPEARLKAPDALMAVARGSSAGPLTLFDHRVRLAAPAEIGSEPEPHMAAADG
jgi:hypothetical protein